MDELYDQLLGILTRIELEIDPDPEHRRIYFQYGSANVIVGVHEDAADNRYAIIQSRLLSNVRLGSPSQLLATLSAINGANQDAVTSKFTVEYDVDDLDKPADIWVEFYVPANALTADTFLAAAGSVANDADDWDDELKKTLGSGETAEERFRDDVEL